MATALIQFGTQHKLIPKATTEILSLFCYDVTRYSTPLSVDTMPLRAKIMKQIK